MCFVQFLIALVFYRRLGCLEYYRHGGAASLTLVDQTVNLLSRKIS